MERVLKSGLSLFSTLAISFVFVGATAWAEETRPLTFRAAAETSSSLYVFGTSDRTLQTDLELSGRYRISSNVSSSIRLAVTQEMVGEKRFLLNDGDISFGFRGWQPLLNAKLETRLKLALPLSIQSRDRDSLLTALTLREQIAYGFKNTGLGLMSAVSLTRAFHQYDTATTGRSERQHQIRANVGLSYSPIDAVELSIDGSRSVSWTYNGNLSNGFGITQEFVCKLAKDIKATIGHSNGGDVLKANGQDSNIALINDTGSKVYVGFDYVF